MARQLQWRWFGIVLLAMAIPPVTWMFLQARWARDLMDPAAARKEGRALPVRTVVVTDELKEIVIGATGLTQPSETVLIHAGRAKGADTRLELIVKARQVAEGDLVRSGQVLFEIEDEGLRHVVLERQAALAAAKAELERVQAAAPLNVVNRQQEFDSAAAEVGACREEAENRLMALKIYERLHRSTLSTLELFDARSKEAQARYMLSNAERRLGLAKNALTLGVSLDKAELAKAAAAFQTAQIVHQEASANVDRCKIKSPLEGFVDKISIVTGSIVYEQGILAEVVKLDPIVVRMDYPQERLDELAIGQKAEVVLDSYPKETFHGQVVRILPQVKTNLRVLPVIVELSNPKNRIKAGVSGFVRLKQQRKTMSVPQQAVLQHGPKAMVFRVEEGKVKIREVSTGPVVDTGMLEVRQGLAPGDEVVVFQNFYLHTSNLNRDNCYLQDNDPVDPNWRTWARRE